LDSTSPFDTEKIDTDGENKNQASSVSGALSTPAVRHLAKQHGLDINQIHGTGKDGRVLKEDVLNYAISLGLISKDLPSIDKVESELKGGFISTSAYEDKTIVLRYAFSIKVPFNIQVKV
jgi:2-oxoisovalerate dehydrogenase E2 component (dihydrolipoyl transacylase)